MPGLTGHLYFMHSCGMYRKMAPHCVPTVHTESISPSHATFVNCMYRKAGSYCILPVHTDAGCDSVEARNLGFWPSPESPARARALLDRFLPHRVLQYVSVKIIQNLQGLIHKLLIIRSYFFIFVEHKSNYTYYYVSI